MPKAVRGDADGLMYPHFPPLVLPFQLPLPHILPPDSISSDPSLQNRGTISYEPALRRHHGNPASRTEFHHLPPLNFATTLSTSGRKVDTTLPPDFSPAEIPIPVFPSPPSINSADVLSSSRWVRWGCVGRWGGGCERGGGGYGEGGDEAGGFGGREWVEGDVGEVDVDEGAFEGCG